MKKLIVLILLCVFVLFTKNVMAQTAQKKANLNVQQVLKASEIIKNNRALFDDPENFKRLLELSRKMKK